MVAEIFSQTTLCSSWHRILLIDVSSSSNYHLDPEQRYLLQALAVGFSMNRCIKSPLILTQTPWCWLGIWFSSIFIHLVGTEQANDCSVSSPSDPGRNFSNLRKIKVFCWRRGLGLFKRFATWSFLCFSMASDKKMALSHLVWEVPNDFIIYLTKKKLKHSHVLGYWPDWRTGIVVSHELDLTNNFGSSFVLSKRTEWGFRLAVPL